MNDILYCEVPTPAKNWVLADFGDEALDSRGVFADVSEASAVAEIAAVNQIHVNRMPHKVVADFRGFYNSTADCSSSVFSERAGQINLNKQTRSRIYLK